MQYHSTRGLAPAVASPQAILTGLAPDGGLYLPQALPRLDWQKILTLDAVSMAQAILGAFFPELPQMDALVHRAYDGKFETKDLTPTVPVGDMTVLELFRGPTSAFKDVALSMLPQLMTASRDAVGMKEPILILTATSGDTGKAALVGFQDVPGIQICVFYPDGGVSQVQRRQMVSQEGENVAVCAIRGNFDDAQQGVKAIFRGFQDKELPFRLSSANSINIGRLVPQITYYFKAYQDLLARQVIRLGEEVNFSVPTGNFGDILAGYLAKQLGLPVCKLICASNANKVLTDFLQTGTYDRRRMLHKTTSPSMDILVSSNLERLLYLLTGDTALVRSYMEQLDKEGAYTLAPALLAAVQEVFWGDYCDDAATAETICRVYKDHGYLCDPHTASAWYAAENYRKAHADHRPMVVLSTASPYKFPAAVLSAIGGDTSGEEFAQMEHLAAMTQVAIPAGLAGLREKPERHTAVIEKEEMPGFVLGL